MRVLVIGEPCIDVIHKVDGKVYNEPGGISYSVVASAVLNDGIETLPVIGLGRDDRNYFGDLFNQAGNINTSGIYETGVPARRVELFYEDENRRWECSTQPIDPTPFEKIEPFLPVEGIHLNLIAGEDIKLETLAKIRSAAPGAHIHIDLHNIVMHHMADGRRLRAPRRDYLAWSGYADTVQVNEEEADVIDPAIRSHGELAEKILASGAKALIVSLAEKGLLLYEKPAGNLVERLLPSRRTTVVDPTGSGDVFGVTFLHSILLGKSYLEAAEAGIEMAAKKVSVAGPRQLLKFKETGANVR